MGSYALSCVLLFFLALEVNVSPMLGESAHDIEEFLAQCESKMVFDQKHKEVVLVLGMTGSGKTSVIQWLAGDNSKLISAEVGSGEFIIVDNNRIGNSTIQSKTMYPELVVDSETGTAYYDISGFADTRGIKNDIATSYFIKRIIDHVDKIKILLVTSYPGIRKGGDRKDFMRLLRHVGELIKNTERYLDGVALVVTKVDNTYRRGQLISDDATMANIAEFLEQVASEIAEQIDVDVTFRAKIIELIDTLISTTRDTRTGPLGRIMLFRRPDDSGPLSMLPVLQQAKQRAQTIISKNLKFVVKHTDDFSYTVSDETKYKLHDLIDALKENLEENIKTVVNDLEKYYQMEYRNKIQNILKITNLDNIEKAESDLIIVQNLVEQLEEGFKNILNLASDLEKVEHCKDMPTLLKRTLTNLNVNISQRILINIASEANFLGFINEAPILKFNFNVNSLKLYIQEAGNKLKQWSIEARREIDRVSVVIDQNIKHNFKSALTHLIDNISKPEKDANDLPDLQKQIRNFSNTIIESQKPPNPEEKINKLNMIFLSFKTKISNYVLQKLKDVKYISFFTNELNLLVKSLNDSQKWYGFLDKLYDKLSAYDVQNNHAVQARCKSFIQSSANYKGKNVQNTNIEFILRDCNMDLYRKEYDFIKSVNLTQHNVELLEDVVNLTLNDNRLSYNCSNSKLVVKGRFVKLSAVDIKNCYTMSTLEIIAMEKVFIDKDMDFTGQNINMIIVAPHWVITGERKIILDGSPGKLIQPMKAAEGQNGRPGMPGGNAGNFLGYGDLFTDSKKIFISANGGNGSPGQAGGNGTPGKDGAVPEIKYDALDYGSLQRERHDNVDYWNQRNFKVSSNNRYLCAFPLIFCRDYEVTGTSCSDGGDGGRGGIGGEGGVAGIVRVPHIEFSAVKGRDGAAGQHGTGGAGGHYSATISVHERRECYVLFKTKYYSRTRIEYHYCSSGITPQGSYSSLGRLRASPNSNVIFENLQTNPAIGEFKTYLQQNLNNTLRKNYLLKILSEVHF